MLNLISINDLIQVTSLIATNLKVHGTWVDYVSVLGPTTPGRTNTIVSTTATSTVVGSPAVNVYRNIRYLSVFNAGPNISIIDITQTDGSNSESLWNGILLVGEFVVCDSTGQWTQYSSVGIRKQTNLSTTPNDIQAFTTPGTYWWIKPKSFTPKMVKVIMYGAGGAGAGASGNNSSTTLILDTGTGGGGGAYNEATYKADDLSFVERVIVGAGGTGRIQTLSTAATPGGASVFGSPQRLVAGGGGGGYTTNSDFGSGGGGGGTGGNGANGINVNVSGGNPNTQVLGQANAGSGADGIRTSVTGGQCGEYGGGSGGNINNPGTGAAQVQVGGSSIKGGGGGGAGGSQSTGSVLVNGKDGGSSNSYTAGGGGAGGTSSTTTPTAGSDGATGSFACGGSGGGGGGSTNTTATAGKGGNGGWPGGGGGGSGFAPFNKAPGGNGGNGGVLVLTW